MADTAGPIPDGTYTLKHDLTYVTGGKLGTRVSLEHIGVLPPLDTQKFEVKYSRRRNGYYFLMKRHCHPHENEDQFDEEFDAEQDDDDDDAAAARPFLRFGLCYRFPKDRQPIIIGRPRLFDVIIEVFGGEERYGLTIGGGSTEKFVVGLAPEKVLPERLDLLHTGEVIYFELIKD